MTISLTPGEVSFRLCAVKHAITWAMDDAGKKRLIGAALLVIGAVIFLPMLVEQHADHPEHTIVLPPPEQAPRFAPAEPPAAPAAERGPAAGGRPAAPPSVANPVLPKPAAEPLPPPPPVAPNSWVVQLASLTGEEAARELVQRLRSKGYPAFVQVAEISGVRYHRVRVGPETDRARADALASKLAVEPELLGNKPLVQAYQP